MKRALLLIAVVVSLLLIPAYGAKAHNTTWYWPTTRAEGALLNNGIQWRNRYDGVEDAQCAGYGRYLYRGGVSYFKHMVCYIEPDNDDPYYLQFHVVSRNSYTVYWLRYA